VRTNPVVLERGLDNQKVDETRVLAEDKTDNVSAIESNVSECRFFNMLTHRLR
jgi:hypothetical protein